MRKAAQLCVNSLAFRIPLRNRYPANGIKTAADDGFILHFPPPSIGKGRQKMVLNEMMDSVRANPKGWILL